MHFRVCCERGDGVVHMTSQQLGHVIVGRLGLVAQQYCNDLTIRGNRGVYTTSQKQGHMIVGRLGLVAQLYLNGLTATAEQLPHEKTIASVVYSIFACR